MDGEVRRWSASRKQEVVLRLPSPHSYFGVDAQLIGTYVIPLHYSCPSQAWVSPRQPNHPRRLETLV